MYPSIFTNVSSSNLETPSLFLNSFGHFATPLSIFNNAAWSLIPLFLKTAASTSSMHCFHMLQKWHT